MVRLIIVGAIAAAFAAVSPGQSDRTFEEAIRGYIDLRRVAAEASPGTVAGADALYAAQQALALRIQSSRPDARQGDILGPIAAQSRQLVRREISGPQGAAMLAAVERTNVYGARVRVNRRYPPGLPRATMPTPLLAKLPSLPPGLEYRFLGRSLLLVDSDASLIVDLIPDVLPPPQSRRAPVGS